MLTRGSGRSMIAQSMMEFVTRAEGKAGEFRDRLDAYFTELYIERDA